MLPVPSSLSLGILALQGLALLTQAYASPLQNGNVNERRSAAVPGPILTTPTAAASALTSQSVSNGTSGTESQSNGTSATQSTACDPVKFTTEWAAVFTGGEVCNITWTGGCSGAYSLAWLQTYNGGNTYELNYIIQNVTVNQWAYYFLPAKCWHEDSKMQFVVYDGNQTIDFDLLNPSFPTGWDASPVRALVAGSDEGGSCEVE